MNVDQGTINELLDKYMSFTNDIAVENDYPNNVKHVLYLIIPAFVIKYGTKYEKMILDCFKSVKIYINSDENNPNTAYFSRVMCKHNDGTKPEYYTMKSVILNQYRSASLIDMFDNLIHEFNHAVNSMINEIKYDDEVVSMRTGLSYITYDINDITHVKSKSNDIALEEIINVKQTEDIVNIIRSFARYDIANEEFKNTLYAIENSISGEYISNAYLLQSLICKELLKNKTFIPTIENLRLIGNVDDIAHWFDNITGIDKSYDKLVSLLGEILHDEKKLSTVKWFKKYEINKIRAKINRVMEIVQEYEKNCIFK